MSIETVHLKGLPEKEISCVSGFLTTLLALLYDVKSPVQGRSCLSMGLAGVGGGGGGGGRNGRASDPSSPRRGRATCRSGRSDVRGTVFGRRQIPKSGEEDGRVAPDFYLRAVEESLLGRTPGSLRSSELQAGVCCADGRLKSLGYVSLGFLFTS